MSLPPRTPAQPTTPGGALPGGAFDDTGVTPLSSQVRGLLTESARRPGPVLPGDTKALLLAAYERRGSAPASGLRLLLGGVRWSVAALSAAAAAILVVFSGSLSSVDAGAGELANPVSASLRSAHTSTGGALSATTGVSLTAERPIVWEQIHPLPSASARLRVIDDQSLSLIGWTPDLEGP